MPNVIYELGGGSADRCVAEHDGEPDWSVPDEEPTRGTASATVGRR